MKIRSAITNVCLLLLTLILAIGSAEIVLRLFISPSQISYGKLFGRELPPYKIFPSSALSKTTNKKERGKSETNKSRPWRERWYKDLVVDGKKITNGDLRGIYIEDELIGHVSKPSSASVNKWWQSNKLGARSRHDINLHKEPGSVRVLVFGDSFANGTSVPQEETFAYLLNEEYSNIEVVNFGVNAYSIGQAYLRFQFLRNKIEHDVVILVFVPNADLWRDVNTMRYIGDAWKSYKINPRFIIKNGQLTLIKSPYPNLKALLKDNQNFISPRLINHLRNYDSFYLKEKYENTSILDSLIIYKLIKSKWINSKLENLEKNLMKPDSEAVRVTKKIIDSMNRDVTTAGGQFFLVIMPKHREVKSYDRNTYYRKKWDEMVSSVCADGINCLDLMDEFRRYPDEKFDKGYDNTHFGPNTHGIIAEILTNKIIRLINND